jgi:transposase
MTKQEKTKKKGDDNVVRRQQLTVEEKRRIIRWHKRGKTQGYIADKLGRSKTAIRGLLHIYETQGKRALLERKRKLSASDRKRILALVERKPQIRAKRIIKKLDLTHVHVDTICRLLRREGYGCGDLRKTPLRVRREEEEEEESSAS